MLRRGPQAEARRHRDQIRQGLGFHLAHHLSSMRLHRDLADAEIAADLLVEHARDDYAPSPLARVA